MVKLHNVSGFCCYVDDLHKSSVFYEGLGFQLGEKSEDRFKVYIDSFWIEFRNHSDAEIDNQKSGAFTHIEVEDVDQFHGLILAKGYEPFSQPKTLDSGSREFTLEDPDGYKLVFFSKKKD